MKNTKIYSNKSKLIAVMLLVTLTGFVNAQTPVGTGFSYQGELLDNGAATNGNYDIILEPYTVESGGSAIPFTFNTFTDVPVVNGLFSLQNVDFGDIIYLQSQAIWIQVSVRKSASGNNYTDLSPRQRIKAVPYAVQTKFANEATLATSATSASNLTISGAAIGDILAYNGGSWSWSRSVSVNGNGSASIGTDLVAPTNGLKVAGDSVFDGDLSQDFNKTGLPKYLVNVSCLDGSNSITSDDLTGNNGTITVTSSGTAGFCFVNYPTSLTGKYFFVSSSSNDGSNTSCVINNGNTSQLVCQRVDRQGNYEYGDFMIVVY